MVTVSRSASVRFAGLDCGRSIHILVAEVFSILFFNKNSGPDSSMPHNVMAH
jgi:hypothetical protein